MCQTSLTDSIAILDKVISLIRDISANSGGLPNLPELAGLWETKEIIFACDPFGYAQCLEADPTRFFFSTSPKIGSDLLMTTIPDTATLNNGQVITAAYDWKYKDYGTLVQQDWFVYDKGVGSVISIFVACIRNKGKL